MPLRSLAIALCVLALVACGPQAATPAPGTTAEPALAGEPGAAAADAAASAEELGEFKVVSVLLGKSVDADRIVLADSSSFARKDTIHASVLSTGAHQGLRLSARWLAPDGSTIADTVQPVVPTAATATTFDISNPAGWPAGEYQVQIGINGRTLQTKTFEVR